MNPSKAQKAETGATLKNVQHAYIQPGALARGRGKSFQLLGSAKVSVGKKALVGESSNHKASSYNLSKTTFNPVPPGFDLAGDDVHLVQEANVMQALKNVQHSYIQPGVVPRGRGQSLQSLGSVKTGVGKRTVIGQSSNHNASSSKQNKPSHNNNIVSPELDQMEDDVPLSQEADVMEEIGAMRKAKRAYIQPGRLAREQRLSCQPSSSVKASGRKTIMIGEGNNVSLPQEDAPIPHEVEMMQDPLESEKAKKVRGQNKNKNVAGLKPGEKLMVSFYNNRVVGKYHATFSRHLGILVRDRNMCNMCPMQVHSWAEIGEDKLEHMWRAVTDKFDSDNMNDQRDNVLKHMRKLWINWRGSLSQIVKSKPLQDALKNVPEGVNKSDWEWLVKEHFSTAKFMEKSARNSINRSNLKMPHRTGSKPIREIIYQKGGKDGNPPDMATIFFETHKKNNALVEHETSEKYAELQELIQSEPSLTNIEVVERCFGPQNKSHVVGFGGGITTKELKGGSSSKAALLDELNKTRKEKESLERRMDNLEQKYENLLSLLLKQHSATPSSSEQSTS